MFVDIRNAVDFPLVTSHVGRTALTMGVSTPSYACATPSKVLKRNKAYDNSGLVQHFRSSEIILCSTGVFTFLSCNVLCFRFPVRLHVVGSEILKKLKPDSIINIKIIKQS